MLLKGFLVAKLNNACSAKLRHELSNHKRAVARHQTKLKPLNVTNHILLGETATVFCSIKTSDGNFLGTANTSQSTKIQLNTIV